MKKLACLSLLLVLAASTLGAATTRNDDSCDVAVMPAATLLLPYFEVDFRNPAHLAQTTLFTIVNTTSNPQIAKVTLWTDWARPVLDFPIYLTGYDVQAINLRDILAGGSIAPTSSRAPVGSRSAVTNPLFLTDAATSCSTIPTSIPAPILAEVQDALTLGVNRSMCDTTRIGGTHTNAIGYATIDLVATCSHSVITDPEYFNELLFDNVLAGDWQIVNPSAASGNFASGSPLVHLRAIPEGGRAGEAAATNLPYTFYDRFAGSARRLFDRRQPLPAAFAARYIQGGGSGFLTGFLVWREGRTAGNAACDAYAQNGQSPVSGMVRFDERENPTTVGSCAILCPTPRFSIPSAANVRTTDSLFPPLTSGDTSGWMALNLDNGGSNSYGAPAGRNFTAGSSTTIGPRPSQNWVVPVLVAEGRYSAAREATALANGCSPAPSGGDGTFPTIAPGPNPTP